MLQKWTYLRFLSFLGILCLATFIILINGNITSAKASVSVSGLISADTTWAKANSPYIVDGNINVDKGAKLTIEPGVEVKFAGNYYLMISGEINAIGTPNNPIKFTSNKAIPLPGDWNTIRFEDSSVDAVLDADGNYVSGSTIQYAVIEFAGNSGLFIHGASPFISSSKIRNNNTSKSQYNAYNGGGVTVVAYDGQTYLPSGGSPVIRNSVITNNGSSGSSSGSAIGVMYSSPKITDNLIFGNNDGEGSITISGGSPIISRNLIVSDNVAINLKFDYPEILYNTIHGSIYLSYSDQRVSQVKIKYNNLDNYQAQYTLINKMLYGSSDIEATNNWWGTESSSVIDSKIYDYYDDFTQGKVNYIPIATSPFENTPPTQPGQPLHKDDSASSGYDDDGSLEFSWKDSLDDVSIDHYNVYVSEDGKAYSSANIAKTNSYTVTGTEGHSYKIKVEAVDTSSRSSLASEESTSIIVDTTSPSVPANLSAMAASTSQINLSWIASTDSGGSGLAGYKIERSPNGSTGWSEIAITSLTSYSDTAISPSTTYWYRVKAYDGVGNESGYSDLAQATTQASPDTTPPPPPESLGANPIGWTNNNSFNLSWTNPSDPSDIKGVYYKLDSAPTSNSDGIYVSGNNISSISDIAVSGNGSHPIYVWLKDGAGNTNYLNRAETTLKYDATPPTNPTLVTETNGTLNNTFQNIVSDPNFIWAGASDGGGSGVKGYYYYWGTDPNGIPTDWATSPGHDPPPVTSPSTHYLRVITEDNAGNKSQAATLFTFKYEASILGQKQVARLWGMTSADTAIAICKTGWPSGSKVALVARDDYFTDALAGGPLAKYISYKHGSSAPILLTNPNNLTNETRAEIQKLGAEKVYLLGGPGAVSEQVKSDLGSTPGVKEVNRLWGQTAYGTALAIKGEMSKISTETGSFPPETAIITTGENFPDSLVISGPAASKNMPILLVKPFKDEPQEETKLALQGITKTIIVGGPGAVHPNLENWLNNNGHKVLTRLWGNSEYDTAIDVASSGNSIFNFNKSTTIVTRGDYFTDALSGGAYASMGPYPMVLVNTQSIPQPTNLWLTGNSSLINTIYILGGWGAVSDGVMNQIQGMIK